LHSAPPATRNEVVSEEGSEQRGEETKKDFLPDYGTTTVEVATIKLVKPKRKKKQKDKQQQPQEESKRETKLREMQREWKRDDLFGNTLIDQTLEELRKDEEFLNTQERIKTIGEKKMAALERTIRQRALGDKQFPHQNMRRDKPTLLQLNIGLYCNQACAHCHVESSPLRKQDVMSAEVAARCITLLENTPSIKTVDITGGAPELCPTFRFLVATLRAKFGNDLEIIDRCNLTVLQEPGQEDLVEFLKSHNVHIIASLPCYSSDNVNKQRGNGVFDRSIASLIAFNRAGYGVPHAVPVTAETDRNNNKEDDKQPYHQLDLVYNPLGAFLPPPQEKLELQYKEQLAQSFGITFNNLYTITNMPIKRFADFLYRRDELKDYMDLLQRNYNPSTLDSLMCKETINIGHTGKVFDCDFNQQLGKTLGITDEDKNFNEEDGLSVFDIESYDDLAQYTIRNDNHCFGCTAGMGSS